jgi:restriction system protein
MTVHRRCGHVIRAGHEGETADTGREPLAQWVCTVGAAHGSRACAEREPTGKRSVCFDLERLFELWVEHYPRIAETSRRLLPLRPIWFLAPERE